MTRWTGIALLIFASSLVLVPVARGFDEKSEAAAATENQPADEKKADENTDEAKPADDKPAEDAKPAPRDPQEEWKASSERKREIAKRLQSLQGRFKTAPADEQKSIREEYIDLLFEYRQVLVPQMSQLAKQIYEANPDDPEAAEFVLEEAYEANDYERALEIANRLREGKAPYQSIRKLALNIAGASEFARHDFEKAKQTLETALNEKLLDRRYGGTELLDQAGVYVKLWEDEQAVREKEAAAEGDDRLPRVVLRTNKGEVELELFENQAPNTVANFISLVEAKKYDGTKFHRVIPNFMAQGGDLTTAKDGQEPGYTIDCESYRDDARKHFRGSLSMAHAGKDTGDSQFFLTVMPTYWLNGQLRPDTNHTVFGRITKGIEIVDGLKVDDTIESAEVLFKRDHEYKPKTKPVEKPEPSGDAKKSDK